MHSVRQLVFRMAILLLIIGKIPKQSIYIDSYASNKSYEQVHTYYNKINSELKDYL